MSRTSSVVCLVVCLVGCGGRGTSGGGVDGGGSGGDGGGGGGPGLQATQLGLGLQAACALSAGTVVCWGWNGDGQLGALGDDHATVPRPVSSTLLTGVTDLDVGGGHACAVVSGGHLVCWGSNRDGELGKGAMTMTFDPPAQASSVLSDVQQVSTGVSHTCVLDSLGDVACFGNDAAGETGTAHVFANTLAPALIPLGAEAVEIAAGDTLSCARLSDGRVKCWGEDFEGGLGDGPTDSSTHAAVTVLGLADAAEIDVGGGFACARRTSGHVVCWGSGSRGELGDGSTASSDTPGTEVMGLADAVSIATGSVDACAARATGAVVCWGYNAYGQLGDGSTTSHPTPVPVTGISDATAVAAGGAFVCALRAGGAVSCWGSNSDGRLGDGTTTESHVPVRVALTCTMTSGCP